METGEFKSPPNLMPLYEYEDEKGRVIEMQRPVALRDQVADGLRRITAPSRISVYTQNSFSHPIREAKEANKQCLNMYGEMWAKGEWRGEYSPNEVKKIYAEDDARTEREYAINPKGAIEIL